MLLVFWEVLSTNILNLIKFLVVLLLQVLSVVGGSRCRCCHKYFYLLSLCFYFFLQHHFLFLYLRLQHSPVISCLRINNLKPLQTLIQVAVNLSHYFHMVLLNHFLVVLLLLLLLNCDFSNPVLLTLVLLFSVLNVNLCTLNQRVMRCNLLSEQVCLCLCFLCKVSKVINQSLDSLVYF